MQKKNINQWAPVCNPTGDRTCNILVYGWHSNQLSRPARAVIYNFRKLLNVDTVVCSPGKIPCYSQASAYEPVGETDFY